MNTSASQIDLKTLMDIHKREIFTNLHCHKLGTIQEFDPDTQTATITINHKADVGGVITDYPELYDVPVFVPAGGGAALTMPIAKGDPCLVLFSDRDIGTWFSQGYTDAVPPTRRKHSIADGLAIVGFRPSTNPVPDYNADDAELRNEGAVLAACDDGLVRIQSKNGESLHGLLAELITCLENLTMDTNTGKRITPTDADLTNIKSKLDNLLQ